MSDNRATRERLQAEALKANLRRRKAKAREKQSAGDEPQSPPPAPAAPDGTST